MRAIYRTVVFALASAAVSLMCACSNDDALTGDKDTGRTGPELTPSEIPSLDQWGMSNEELEISNKLWDFSFRLLSAVSSDMEKAPEDQKQKNLCISPLSAVIDMQIVANSADDTYRKALLEMLGLDDMDKLNEFVNKMIRSLVARNEMSIGNSVWYNTAVYESVSKEYEDMLKSTFYADVNALDFLQPDAADIMNKWVENSTSGYIKDMFTREMLANSDLWFVNALYYGSSWDKPFDPRNTKKEHFLNNGTEKTDVQMMHNELITGYRATDDYTCANLATATSDYTFILPREGMSAQELARELTLDRWLNRDADTDRENIRYNVNLSVPKFNVSAKYTLTDPLAAMGMPGSIAPERMGLTPAAAGGRTIDVFQKIYSSVDESGVKVAAATATGSFDMNNGSKNPKIVNVRFVLDRPFLYFIRHRSSGAIIMIGYINEL